MEDKTVAEPVRRERTAHVETRYELLETLGRGGMGEVVAARDRVLGREIAIKRMIEDSPTPVQVNRFLREARVQGWLDHPSIPPLHELANDEHGRPYFVMKRLTGITLGDILDKLAAGDAEFAARYPRERLLRALAEVCLAVELAHTRGVIHRDLKPANIMLGEFGEVFVLDWGVAKVVGAAHEMVGDIGDRTPSAEQTQAGAIVGTPAYMAPEQFAGVIDLDGRADVYALGCILREILLPALRVSATPPEALDVPPELDDVARSATASDRNARMRSARELAARIQRYLDGDRDLAERRRLATEHLARARDALADKRDDGRTAMREAGRALALDPTLDGAAELVGRLMLEPPAVTPPEVAGSLDRDATESQREQARRGRLFVLLIGLFLPFMAVMGIRDIELYVAFGAATLGLFVLTIYGVRHPIPTRGVPVRPLLVIALYASLIVVIARISSPLVIAPSAALLGMHILVGAPAYRNPRILPILIVGFLASFIVPLAGELLGFLPQTYRVEPHALCVWGPDIPGGTSETAVILGIVTWSTSSVIACAGFMLRLARGQEQNQARLYLQAWRLRQLLPTD